MLYVPLGSWIEHAWQHPAHGRLAFGGETPRLYEVVQFLEEEFDVRYDPFRYLPSD